ncbi:MAG: hypothetical protein ACON4Z_16880 [Planctomycetota bacterium]
MTARRRQVLAVALAALAALPGCGRRRGPPAVDALDGAPLPVARFGPQALVADLAAHDDELGGVSGIVASRAHAETLWAISDTATQLFAIRTTGADVEVARTRVRGVRRFDWEDLAWFEDGGVPFLMIADVGTNRPASAARRRAGAQVGQLHVVREPRPGDAETDVLRTVTFTLPCEPIRDIESVAVDVERREILLVEKRAPVKRLLVLDLDQDHHAPTADDWTPITLPDLYGWERQPASLGARHLYQTSWRRNPTALDVRGRRAVLLTNRHAYVYERAARASWRDAFAARPRQLPIPFRVELPGAAAWTVPAGAAPTLPQREAACFAANGAAVFVASERRGGPEAWLAVFRRR